MQAVVLKETEFDHQNESFKYAIIPKLRPSGFCCWDPIALFDNRVTVYKLKNFAIHFDG